MALCQPKKINTYGGKVWRLIIGPATKTGLEFTATGKHNDRPLYTSGPFKIFYILSIGKWVLGFGEPSEENQGTSSAGLFSSDV